MLTISSIKNSAGAAKYFAKEDNYYLSEVDARENSAWLGVGADKLGLSNKQVLEKDLQQVMEGKLPNGVTIGLQSDGSVKQVKHRAGYELCFHAPKSVSILALDGNDQRFYDAHFEAVKETLKAIEEDCAQARVFKNKKVDFENTKNLTIAVIRHTASRSLDPHLHHHALVMNATERQDKSWRALASNMAKDKAIHGFFEQIYHNQIYYGLIYRNSLANKVQQLGCEIEIVGKHGMWEIKGVSKEARDAMSKRRKTIEELLDKLNYHSFKAADIASLDSREKKPKNIRLEEMRQTWKDELAKVGFSSKEFLNELSKNKDKNKNKKIFEYQNLQDGNSINDAREAIRTVKDAAWYLSQYQLKLDYVKIISQSMEFAIGKTTHSDIVKAVEQLIKEGFFIPLVPLAPLTSLDKSGSTFVTKELIETEKAIMDFVERGKNQWSGLVLKDNDANNTVSISSVSSISTDSQKEKDIKKQHIKYATNILQSKDRINLVESNGDNKDLIASILELAESAGKTVRVLSPNRVIANDINENVRRHRPNNLWQWLVSLGKPEIGESVAGFKHKYKEEVDLPSFLLRFKQRKDVIIADSAEALGGNDLKTILELTEKPKAKVILLRDVTNERGFGAGNLIETLEQAGIAKFKIKNLGSGNSGLEQGQNAFDTFGAALKVIPELKIVKNNNKRTLQLAQEYAQYVKDGMDHSNAIVLVGSKEQLKATNEAIRKELRANGKISDVEHSIPVLNPVYLSKPEAILAHKYHKNMVIRFYGGEPNDWSVDYCDREANRLKLAQGRRRMTWDPKKEQSKFRSGKYGVFKKETLQIAQGDKLIATSNMYDLGIKNGTKFTIGNIDEKYIELLPDTRRVGKIKERKEAKTIKVSLTELQNKHFQYDYATTINKLLKKPVSHIIADFKAYSLDKPTIDELNKRAKETLTIFTNDGEAAKRRFGHIPIRITATEMLLDSSQVVSNAGNTVNKALNDKNNIGNIINSSNANNTSISNKTIAEIKSDLEKAIGILREQYEFRSQDERRAVDFAIEKITSHNAGFDYRDLVKEALEYTLKELMSEQKKGIVIEDIKRVIEEKQASGELIIGRHLSSGVKWTTKEALELERSIIAGLEKGSNKLDPLLDPKTLKIPTTNGMKFTKDQKNAISLITTTKDQYVIVQGYAGTGKTAMFVQVQKMIKEANSKNTTGQVKILGLAPTHQTVNELKAIGIKAQTLKNFLIMQKRIERIERTEKFDNKAPDSKRVNILDNKLIILDEISMVPNEDLWEFITVASKSRAHAVLSGDRDQHLPINSGKPVEIAQDSKVLKTVFLKEIVRQRNLNLKEAVESVINGNYAHALDKIEQENPQNHIERINADLINKNKNQIQTQSQDQIQNLEKLSLDSKSNLSLSSNLDLGLDLEFFKNLQKSIIEIDNNELKPGEKTLQEMVAEDFLTRTPEIRDKTVVIVHANKDREVINNYIRDGLKKLGVIEKSGIQANRLISAGFTAAEHKSLKSYNAGDIVKLGNGYYHVINVDVETKSLLLKDGSGKTRYFYPEKEADRYNMEVYSLTKEELAVGDVIRLTKTDKKRGLFANFEYRVKEVNDQQAIIESRGKNRSQIVLNHRKLKDSHWDYAQTVTSYGFQGGSSKYAIAFEVSYRRFLANVRSFYISISRAIEHLSIYTDNKGRFLKRLLSNKGDKYSALEVTGELEKLAKNQDQAAKLQEKSQENSAEKLQIKLQAKLTEKLTEELKKINTTIYSVKDIKQALETQAETVVEQLLGRPNDKLSSSKEWRYGNKGSLVISMLQDKRGFWKNFETGEAGNLIGLLQKELGLSFPETLKYASDRFGIIQNQIVSSKTKISRDQKSSIYHDDNGKDYPDNKNAKTNAKTSKTSEYAHRLAKESLPITGTIVEKYLKEHRGIKNIDGEDIRYHPRVFAGKNGENEKQKYLPAMLSIGRDKDGKIQCVQATYLDPKTANKSNLDVKKRTYASPSGVLVSLQDQKQEVRDDQNNKINGNNGINKISFIAEGTETGLSIRDATRDIKNSEVVVTLGKSNFTTIDPKSVGSKVIFCLDNDGPKTSADLAIHKAAERLSSFGKEVFIAIPRTNEKNTKVDFNDIAKTVGIGAIKNMIDNSVSYKEWTSVGGISINQNIVEKIMLLKQSQTQNIYLKSYESLLQKSEINLIPTAKFINPEKNNLDKYLNTYGQMQRNLFKQAVIETPKINSSNTQKDLSKIERELY